jgi:hypothetical protein
MADISWYAEASLVSHGRVFCAGSLAQCVRRWIRLQEEERATSFIKLHDSTGGHQQLDSDIIAQYALRPELKKA